MVPAASGRQVYEICAVTDGADSDDTVITGRDNYPRLDAAVAADMQQALDMRTHLTSAPAIDRYTRVPFGLNGTDLAMFQAQVAIGLVQAVAGAMIPDLQSDASADMAATWTNELARIRTQLEHTLLPFRGRNSVLVGLILAGAPIAMSHSSWYVSSDSPDTVVQESVNPRDWGAGAGISPNGHLPGEVAWLGRGSFISALPAIGVDWRPDGTASLMYMMLIADAMRLPWFIGMPRPAGQLFNLSSVRGRIGHDTAPRLGDNVHWSHLVQRARLAFILLGITPRATGTLWMETLLDNRWHFEGRAQNEFLLR
jgi:hypothetical protein